MAFDGIALRSYIFAENHSTQDRLFLEHLSRVLRYLPALVFSITLSGKTFIQRGVGGRTKITARHA